MRKTLMAIFTVVIGLDIARGQTFCSQLENADKTRLLEYVQKKYKVPRSVHLEVAEVARVSTTCFRKLKFSAPQKESNFYLELFASPDLRFLTRDLMDSSTDPIAEEIRNAEALSTALTNGEYPTVGGAAAKVTVAVFSDFECPYCARFANIMRDLSPEDAAKVRVVFRHFPLSMHPWARQAAEAAACAQDQGNSYFWLLHDFLFVHQKELTRDNLLQKLAESIRPLSGFDYGKFTSCIIERKSAARVDQDIAFAQKNAINATPTVFINGRQVQVVTPEQLHTLIREFSDASISQASSEAQSTVILKDQR